jgi:peptidase E
MNGSFNSFVFTPSQQNADMMNFFLTPAAIKAETNKYTPSKDTTMLTKIPQAADEQSKETFNDKTRKSLLKLNLFIKRLKWFNIFTDTQTPTKAQKSTEMNQKW